MKYWLAVLTIFGFSFNLFPEEIPRKPNFSVSGVTIADIAQPISLEKERAIT